MIINKSCVRLYLLLFYVGSDIQNVRSYVSDLQHAFMASPETTL